MKRDFYWYDAIAINVYYLGLTAISQSMVSLLLPLLVQGFVGPNRQGTYIGLIRLWGLLTALLTQAVMGLLSDHSQLPWGRRRPFILAGSIVSLLTLSAMAYSAGMTGMRGYWMLFILYILLQFGANTSQGALQCLIPDLVHIEKLGAVSGVKALLEVPVAVIVVTLTVGRFVEQGNILGGLIALMVILVIALLVTLTVKETTIKYATNRLRVNWTPVIRLLFMTAVFASFILVLGGLVGRAGNWLAGVESLPLLLLFMGGLGLLSMAAAVILGVKSSIWISLGGARDANTRSYIWWVISRLAFLVGSTNLASFVLYFLQARLGYSDTSAAGPASQMMMLVGLFLLISALPSGWLTDRYGQKIVTAVSGLIAALGTLIMLLARNILVIYIGGSVIGIAAGLFYTASWALGITLVPRDEAGRFLGISNLAGAGAGAIGAYIGGPLADFFTVHAPQAPGIGYVLIFVIYGLLFLLSVAALLGVETQSHR
ncbi:MAG: MFS transporter [Anaerolineae bacterium]|nr:MFS transporter [Anaerolineae bacterium]